MGIEHQTVGMIFFCGGVTGAGAGSWLGLGLVGERDVDFLKGGWKGVFVCI